MDNLPRPARKARLEEAYADLEKKIKSWKDLYNHLHGAVEGFRAAPSPDAVVVALFMHHAFVCALEDLPEEGDCLAIAKRMFYILHMQPERVGFDLFPDSQEVRPGVTIVTIDPNLVKTIMAAGGVTAPEQPAPDDALVPAKEEGNKLLH